MFCNCILNSVIKCLAFCFAKTNLLSFFVLNLVSMIRVISRQFERHRVLSLQGVANKYDTVQASSPNAFNSRCILKILIPAVCFPTPATRVSLGRGSTESRSGTKELLKAGKKRCNSDSSRWEKPATTPDHALSTIVHIAKSILTYQ